MCAPRPRPHRTVADGRSARRHRLHRAVQLRLRQASTAASSSCASRTPTARARRRRPRRRSCDALRWVGPDVGRGPGRRRPVRPVPPARARRRSTASTPRMLLERGAAYRCFCTAGAARAAARAQQRPRSCSLGYDGHCRELAPAEARGARGRRRAARRPPGDARATGAIDVRRSRCAARSRSRTRRSTTRCCSSRTACRPTTWPTSSTIT